MQPVLNLDDILLTLNEYDYIETIKIEMCGTIDDSSHVIKYKKNRKNAGKLTEMTKTADPYGCEYGAKRIQGQELVIGNLNFINSIFMDYLRDCAMTETFNPKLGMGTWFVLYVMFSNKAKTRFVINTPSIVERSIALYQYLRDDLVNDLKEQEVLISDSDDSILCYD